MGQPHFRRVGRMAEGQSPKSRDICIAAGSFARFHFGPNSQTGGLLQYERMIRQMQRLQWDSCCRSPTGRCVGVRTVEQGQKRVLLKSLGHEIDCSVVCLIAFPERVVLSP